MTKRERDGEAERLDCLVNPPKPMSEDTIARLAACRTYVLAA